MTYHVRVTFVLVLVLVNCAISLKCPDGVSPEGGCDDPIRGELIAPELSTHTAEPLPKPEALSMVVEDEDQDQEPLFQPTIPPTTTTSTAATTTTASTTTTTTTTTTSSTNATDEPKGRAINFSLSENSNENGLTNSSSSKHGSSEDLSDVSMDGDDETDDVGGKILASKTAGNVTFGTSCTKGGLTYENGEKLETGCDSICTCTNGTMNCTDRCTGPYFRRGKKINDPLCVEKEVEDPCCAILVCAADSTDKEIKPLETCYYKNRTYDRNERIEEGCESLCTCESGGKVTCRPRCAPVNKTSDRCVVVPDPYDSCCKKVLCDVTLDDHEPEKQQDESEKLKLLTAKFVNETAVKLEFDVTLDSNHSLPEVEVSSNKNDWATFKLLPGGYLLGTASNVEYVKIKDSDDVVQIHKIQSKDTKGTCQYKGRELKMGEEYNDNCTSLCVCRESGVQCLDMECPTYFGVDVLNPNCIEWETDPINFNPSPPNCCPKSVKCKNTGSCEYEGVTYSNWQQIPTNITGCEKRCFCEMGKLECQNACPPVTALPPAHLGCPAHLAYLDHLPDDDCCMYWMCNSHTHSEGPVTNKTKDVKKVTESAEKETGAPFTDPFTEIPTKPPSKILGPLLVYTNREPETNTSAEESPELHLLPNITLNENHYYDKEELEEHHEYVMHKGHKKAETAKQNANHPPFLGPLLPTNYPPDIKQSKPPNKSKPHKQNTAHFSTVKDQGPHSDLPPAHNNQPEQHSQFSFLPPPNQPVIPNKRPPLMEPELQQPQFPFLPSPNRPDSGNKPSIVPPNNHHVEVHGKGDPDELLQFINQHPELANYPSGSVFEIHNVPANPQQRPDLTAHINPNSLIPPNNRPLVPYVIQGPPNHQQEELAPGINVEHILQHIHKNSQPFIPFPNAPIQPHNGQLLITAPNGLVIPTKVQQNLTRPGGNGQIFPGGFMNVPPGYQQSQEEINVHTLEAIDAHTIRLAFSIPPVIVGLHGRVEVRYTHKDDSDPNNWQLQVFAPPNDLIETPQLEFDLLGLKEDTEYKIKITITLRDLHNTPSSRVYTVRTMKDVMVTTLPPMIPIEPNLIVTDVNATWANLAWRKFTDYELQFIDGVQLRYREIDGKIYAATPLIHRAVTTYTIENLKPNAKYESGIFFIPFPGQSTELHSENMIHFTTADQFDSYGFNVTLEMSHVKSTSVEITWSGVPYPEDKYVNIYRAIYQSDSGKGDFSTFKVAKRDSPPKTTIMDLKPGIRYRLWLEIYLTNGRIKTSNVQDFTTKPRSAPSLGASTQQGKLEAGDLSEQRGDYYGPLVIVAILAAIAILSTLILLLILVKRHSQNKAAITPPPRVSQSAYDNPTYKVEIQQETMDL